VSGVVATECSECERPEVAWFINSKAYCETCADARYEIQEEPFDEQ
jgi:hypothetical protein